MSSVRLNQEDYTVVMLAGADGVIQGTAGTVKTRGVGAAGSVQFTRPADTISYIALDVIGSASTAIHEIALGVPAGATVQIDTLTLTINRTTLPAGMGTVVCHFYTAAPAAIADNAPFSAAAADRALYAGSATLSTPTIIGGGFLYGFLDYIGRKIKLTTSSIFVVLQTTGGFPPASATEYLLRARGVDLGA